MENSNNVTISDFLVTFFIGNVKVSKLLSEVISNKDNQLFLEETGLPEDFIIPFYQEKGSNSLVYTLKQDMNSKYDAILNNEVCFDHIIQNNDYIVFKNYENNNTFRVLFTDTTNLDVTYDKYKLPRNSVITIGRNNTNNISYNLNNLVSRDRHLTISVDGAGNATIKDNKRSVGLYVNDQLTYSKQLQPFDEIYLAGLSIIYLGDSIAIHNHHGINYLYPKTSYTGKVPNLNKVTEKDFVRSPRILKSLEHEEIEVDAPPKPPNIDKTPAILVLGPSFTMAFVMVASLSMSIANAFSGGNFATVIGSGIMAIGMMIGSILWPVLLRKYQRKTAIEENEYRVKKYSDYIASIDRRLTKSADKAVRLLNDALAPSPNDLVKFLDNESSRLRLWERSYYDNDFLAVRMGLGNRPFDVKLKIPKNGFELHEDRIRKLPDDLEHKFKYLRNVPVLLDLKNNTTVGIVGLENNINNIIDEIILNILSLHSYDEVKMVIITSPKQQEQFEIFKDVPHIWSNDKTVRYFATNPEEVHYIFNIIDEVIKEREEADIDTQKSIHIPHYVFIITDPDLVEKEALYRYLNNSRSNVGITSIFAYGDITQIPKACETIIQADSNRTGYYTKNQNENEFIKFTPDTFNIQQLDVFAKNLAKLNIKRDSRTLSIPESISFLQMYKAGNIQELNIEQKWESNNSAKTLATPVGVLAGGEVFNLDIHEAYHGSHGLVAGTTGSGKSEFLQAYVLSLAINYSPKEVAFVLVDFKGGDMARPFMEKANSPALPHLAATISNLSDNVLYRALVSFEAEIKSRQRLFNEAATYLGVDKIDINSYHRYFKAGKLDIPLPHLVIIIDEFAQLKTQQPDFLTQLINIAQVGRSLGIHLILATQKPSGLVDPQIWSNSRFKVCLRVADKQDSIDMINKPDSAMIKNPGRMFLQVGYDEIFECIQSGFSGANYEPTERFVSEDEITVEMTDNTANAIQRAKINLSDKKTDITELEAAVAEIVKLGLKKNTFVKPLWLEMLPEELTLDQLKKSQRGICTVTFALVDYVKTQKQEPLTIDLAQTGHIGFYGMSGTGKTTFLHTFVYSLINDYKYSPNEVNIYALDFGGRNLGYLENLPHTGGVVYADEEDKLKELIDLLKTQIEDRKYIFADNNVGTFEDYKKISKKPLPAIVVLLDNYASFHEKYLDLADEMVEILSSGKTFGIYFVITGSTRNAIHYRAAEHISTYFTLKMNDPANYLDIHNMRPPILPEDYNGRGITVINREMVEFQIAIPLRAKNEAERLSLITEKYKTLNRKWQGDKAIQLTSGISATTPKREPKVQPTVKPRKVRITKNTLKPIPNDINNLIIGKSKTGTLSYGLNLTEEFKLSLCYDSNKELQFKPLVNSILSYDNRQLIYIDFENKNSEFKNNSRINFIDDLDKLDYFIEELKPQLNDRLDGNENVLATRLFITISDFNNFFDTVTNEQAAFFRKVLKFLNKPEYNITFVTGYNCNTLKLNDSLFLGLIVNSKNFLIAPNTYKKAVEKIESIPVINGYKDSQYYLTVGKDYTELYY